MTSIKIGLVSTIVLNWNGKEIILPCLESLLAQTYKEQEIILVDNGSTDGSLEVIEKKYSASIQIIKNKKNLGFAEGVNIGICRSRGEFIALLNSDAVADKNWLAELVTKIRQSDSIGMCASKIYLAGRDKILDNTGEVLSRDGLNRARGRLETDRGQWDGSEDVLCPSGCAAFYRRKMLDEAGLFDPHFFVYGEDLEIGLRGRLLGYTCVYVPSAVAYHRLSASGGKISRLKAYFVERNRLWIVIKCFPLRHLLFSPFHTLLRYFYHLSGLVRKKGPAAQFTRQFSSLYLFLILLKAYASTLYFLPHLLSERRRIRRQSRVPDREFEAWLRRYGIDAKDAALNEIA